MDRGKTGRGAEIYNNNNNKKLEKKNTAYGSATCRVGGEMREGMGLSESDREAGYLIYVRDATVRTILRPNE